MSAQPQPQTPARPTDNRRTSSIQKRTSVLPKPSSLTLSPSVLVAQHCQFSGTYPISIGPNTVLHPHSKISSAAAPVVLGEGVVVYERVKIGVGSGPSSGEDGRRTSLLSSSLSGASSRDSVRAEGTVIGKNVVIETGAIVEAAEIGEGSVVEVGAVAGRGSVVGKWCTICPMTILPPNSRVPDFTVVYSGTERRIDKTLQLRPELLEAKLLQHKRQVDMFKRLIPNNIAKWM